VNETSQQMNATGVKRTGKHQKISCEAQSEHGSRMRFQGKVPGKVLGKVLNKVLNKVLG